jgi:chitin disaccharide deacetylase
MELILYNDDLGVTHGLNQAIFECAAAGITTGAAIRTNGAAFADAVERVVPALPDLELGLHLNLTEGRPDLPPDVVPELVDRRGRFRRGFASYLTEMPRQPRLRAAVERELRAQFQTARAAGLAINHVNGHQHVHLVPAVFEVVCRLMTELGIGIVRLPREPWFRLPTASDSLFALRHLNHVKHALLNRLSGSAEAVLRHHGHAAVSCFVGVLATGRMSAAILDAAICELERRGIRMAEVLFHPADIDDPRDARVRSAVPAYYFARERRLEKESLLSPGLQAVLAAHGARLVNHRQWATRRMAADPGSNSL